MELIKEYISNGLSTDQDDINRAADIIGNSAIGHLVEIANNNEEISGKRIGTMFYNIAFRIWHWEQAISFYNKYSNSDYGELRKLRDKNKELENKIEALTYQNDEYGKQFSDVENERDELKQKEAEMHKKYRDAVLEIFELKSKLYDIMMAGA